MSGRTLLIGLDGATFDVLDPLMAGGHMPVLAGLAAGGVRAVLRSTVPALTPPAWTSMLTGRHPGGHGIFDFFRKNTPEGLHFALLTSRDVSSPPLWSMASAHGLRATVLNFPLTFPPPDIRGHVVPGGFMPWRQLRLGIHPSGLFNQLKQLPRFNPRELALDMSEEAKAIEGCADEELEAWIDMHIRRERQWVDIAGYLAGQEPSAFTAVLFDGVDKLQHLCWRFIDPRMAHLLASDWEQRIRAKCLEYLTRLDALVGELVAAQPDGTSVFVTSDHGFGPQVRTLYVNAWLRDTGRLTWKSGEAPASAGASSLGLNQMARHVFQIDWTRTAAYAPMPSGNGVHLVAESAERPGGVPANRYAEVRDTIASELLQVRDPETGERVVARVWTRDEIFQGEHLALAPDLTLELEDGGLISILDADVPVRRRAHPTGTHRPDGIFIASGPRFQQGARLTPLSIVDVAPLMLYTLDMPLPATLDGRFAAEAIDAATLAATPPAQAADSAAPTAPPPSASAPVLDAEAEAEILKRLQALGYVE